MQFQNKKYNLYFTDQKQKMWFICLNKWGIARNRGIKMGKVKRRQACLIIRGDNLEDNR